MDIDSATILAVSSYEQPSDISLVYSDVPNKALLCVLPTGLPMLPLIFFITLPFSYSHPDQAIGFWLLDMIQICLRHLDHLYP